MYGAKVGRVYGALVGLVGSSLLLASGCSGKSGSTGADVDPGAVRAKVSACFGEDLVTTLRNIISPDGFFARANDCMAAADDCDAVMRCVGIEPKACSLPNSCVDGVSTRCETLSNGVEYESIVDCSANTSGNTQCGSTSSAIGEPRCSTGPCALGELAHCEGDTMVSCSAGLGQRSDCSAGYTCATDSQGQNVGCVLAQPKACAADFCDGSSAVYCARGVERLRSDCVNEAPAGTCTMIGVTPSCVAGEQSEQCPVSSSYRSWCENDWGIVCYLGARVATDCSAFQGAHCAELAGINAACQL